MCVSVLTALVEIGGTLLGFFTVTLATAILPFALAFAGGTMLYVITTQMLPDCAQGSSPYAMLAGFCLMIGCEALLA